MKHAIIVEGPAFNGEKAEELVESSLEMNRGKMSFGAAMMAEDGVTKCPKCEKNYWAEAKTLQCPDCGWEWTT